ncbi:MAG: LysR family transcriptional regulator [Clostridia bacterium]|nr:LysR family transcriptional regulator [Clostridia bacterium]
MTIENLQCFVILAQELSFTRAAERANISQTALSRKITSMEDELRVSLFLRDHHKVELSHAGREFYNKTVSILQEYKNSVVLTQNVHRGVRETLQVGFGVYEQILFRPVIHDFLKRYPVPKINCLQFKYKELLDEFMHDHIDIIVTSDQFINTVPRDDLELVLVHDHPWVLALCASNPLAKAETIALDALKDEIVVTMHEGSVTAVRSGFRGMVPFRSVDYVNSFEAKLMLIDAGRGVGFIPRFVDVSQFENIVTRDVTPFYRPRRYYAIHKKNNGNPYTQILSDMLCKFYENKLWMQKIVF